MGNAVLNTTITIDYLKEIWYFGLGFGLKIGVCWEFFLALPRAMRKPFSICQIQFHICKIQTLIICSALSFEVGRIFKAQYALVHKRITVYPRRAEHDCTPAEGCVSVEKRSDLYRSFHSTVCPGMPKCLPEAIPAPWASQWASRVPTKDQNNEKHSRCEMPSLQSVL